MDSTIFSIKFYLIISLLYLAYLPFSINLYSEFKIIFVIIVGVVRIIAAFYSHVDIQEHGNNVIDANGYIVCPGFIDLNSHSDFSLFSNPKAESKIIASQRPPIMSSSLYPSCCLCIMSDSAKTAHLPGNAYHLVHTNPLYLQPQMLYPCNVHSLDSQLQLLLL